MSIPYNRSDFIRFLVLSDRCAEAGVRHKPYIEYEIVDGELREMGGTWRRWKENSAGHPLMASYYKVEERSKEFDMNKESD